MKIEYRTAVAALILIFFPGILHVAGCSAYSASGRSARTRVVTVKRNSTIKLTDRVSFTFVAHSHKMTMQGGPSSPLIVYVRYDCGSTHEEHQYNIFFHEKGGSSAEPAWEWKGHVFVIIDYRYNDYMKLRIYKKPVP